jgi:hypothetical protein
MLLLALLACDGTDTGATEPTCFERDATVLIGASGVDAEGRPTWTEMPEGSEQTMVHGPQGGWHVLASADVRSMDEIVTLVYTITWPARGDVELSRGQFRVMLVANEEDCGGVYAGMYGVLDVTGLEEGDADTPPELLAGEALDIRLEAVDESGRVATDTRSIRARLDPADVDDSGG